MFLVEKYCEDTLWTAIRFSKIDIAERELILVHRNCIVREKVLRVKKPSYAHP